MKAIALVSGGLDSILAARLVQLQGIDAIPLNFTIPFSSREKDATPGVTPSALTYKALGRELKSIDLSEDFFELIRNPRHGFGANMNPCIDCKILMLQRAGALMRDFSASFVVTGEVLSQRPMSQHRQALDIIARRSGLEGLLLRPLSARLLPETRPEREGWVLRDKLLGLSGRSRKPQMQLAGELKITDYLNPAGGCLLTDAGFSRRLKDFILHGELNKDNIELLKTGRHFKLSLEVILAVGRNERENGVLSMLARKGDYLFYPGDELAGPTALGRGFFDVSLIRLACRITCRYCDLGKSREADILYKKIPQDKDEAMRVSVAGEKELVSLRI